MTVEWVRFGDVLDMRRVPVEVELDSKYSPVGLRAFGRGIFDYPVALGADLSKVRYFDLPAAALVISNIKGWEGAVAVTALKEEGRIASSRFLTYRPKADLDLSYVRHWLLSDGGMSVLDQCSPGSADRNRTLSRKGLESSLVPLPRLDEQRRIAAHLDRLSQAVPANVGTPSSSMVALLRDWRWAGREARVGDLVERVIRAESVEPTAAYRMHGVRWYGDGAFLRETRLGKDLSAETVYVIAPSDLIYNRLFAWKQSFAIVDAGVEGHVSNEFPTYRVDETQVMPEFLLSQLLSTAFTTQVSDASTGSTPTSRNRLKERVFETLTVEVPDLEVQRRAVAAMRSADELSVLDRRRQRLAEALVPAARNEIFNAMR